MNTRRKIEIFTAGCPVCEEAIALVRRAACPSCKVEVLDIRKDAVADKAKAYGVRSLPAVAVDGKLADCCAGRGPDIATLKEAGVGKPLE
ncbi:MAG TPA: hypothetical protein DD658_03150 [Deltaproteobacteria bacterium]|nr:MAG: hypothetical protein A2X88_07355 [Deltaproteobacteria bacterium GWC2_65_14]HBO69179.1 hypothetical protein [Deltaproteobacteria bacterium]